MIYNPPSSTGGTPGGSNTQLQYNNNGAFGGISGATTNGTSVTLTSPTIAKLANLSTNGFVTTTGGDGTLVVDTNTYTPTIVLTRTIPSAVGDYVNIGSFSKADGVFNLFVSLTFDDGGGQDSIGKQYFLSGNYGEGGFYIVSPISKADTFSAGNNFNLEAEVSGATLNLRIHKTVGTATFDGKVRIVDYGGAVFTPSTSTGSASQPVSFWYGAVAPLGTGVVSPGGYSYFNWNGTGLPIFDFFNGSSNNGGSTPSNPLPSLVLSRDGALGQSYANFVEFNISRYTNDGTKAKSQLDIALTDGDNDGHGTNAMSFRGDKSILMYGLMTKYNNADTTGYGIPAIYGSDRSTGQTAAKTLTAYTVGASDGSFLVSANVNVTTSTTHSFNVTCTYTDETNTSRTLNLSFSNLAGTFLQTITNVLGTGAYEGIPLHIRAKAGTTITIASTGTFTSVTYNLEEFISQIA